MQRDPRAFLEGELAAVQVRLAGQDPEQGRLPGPVRAGQGQPVAPLDLERDSVEQERPCDLLAEVGSDLLVVAGRPLTVAEAAALAEWPSERIARAAADLVARGVVLDSGTALQPAHDLIRTAALAELPVQTRRTLHRRLAEWLEGEAGEDLRSLRESLEHRRAGGLPTVELATRLARSPRRTLLGVSGLEVLADIVDDAGSGEGAIALNEQVAELASELGAITPHWRGGRFSPID